MTGLKGRGTAYSLILCASLSMNCLTTQAIWALDAADATTNPPAGVTTSGLAPTSSPPAGATTSGTAASTGSPATSATTSGPAPTGSQTAPTATSEGTAPAASPAGSPGATTAASTSKSAPATTAATVAPTAAGPLQSDRNNIRNWMLAAQKRGVGIGGYLKVYDDMENSVRAGEPQANIKKKVDSICRAIADQYHTSAKIQRDNRPGVRTGGVMPYQIMYEGKSGKWQGKTVDQGVISEEQEVEHKKALEKLYREEKTGEFTGDAIEARKQLNQQREENFYRLMHRFNGQTGVKVPQSAFIDDLRKNNTGNYYEKSRMRKEQQERTKQLMEQYNPKNWVQPPYNNDLY